MEAATGSSWWARLLERTPGWIKHVGAIARDELIKIVILAAVGLIAGLLYLRIERFRDALESLAEGVLSVMAEPAPIWLVIVFCGGMIGVAFLLFRMLTSPSKASASTGSSLSVSLPRPFVLAENVRWEDGGGYKPIRVIGPLSR